VALDGDGDRVILIDRNGSIVRPEQLGALIATTCFDHPKLVHDLKCASLLAEVVRASHGTTVMRPSGYGFIKAAMIETQAELGVEASGHHFFGLLGGGDDGLFTALAACALVQSAGEPLDRLVAPFPWPAITPDIRLPYDGDAQAALETIAASCGGRVSRLDGIRAEYDAGWALARASITEPAMTLRFEGRDREHLRQIVSRFLGGVPDLRERTLESIDE
jgi:phosphomannomutase/phosphoglucomutase